MATGTRMPGAIVCASLPQRRVPLARLEGSHDRRAAFGLHDDHLGTRRANQSQRFQFGEALPHADDAGAAAGRVDDGVGHAPAELLGQFEAHRLLALLPVWF